MRHCEGSGEIHAGRSIASVAFILIDLFKHVHSIIRDN